MVSQSQGHGGTPRTGGEFLSQSVAHPVLLFLLFIHLQVGDNSHCLSLGFSGTGSYQILSVTLLNLFFLPPPNLGGKVSSRTEHTDLLFFVGFFFEIASGTPAVGDGGEGAK